nr:hypothetical protein [uncultured Sulfurimonas sp.]
MKLHKNIKIYWSMFKKNITIKSLYFVYVVVVLLTFYFSGSVSNHNISTKNEAGKKYKESINELRTENMKRQAQEIGIPIIKGAQGYKKVLLQSGTLVKNTKTKKVTTLKNIPTQGVIKKAFIYKNNYYFYENSIAYKILKAGELK